MGIWNELSGQLSELLKLKTRPVAFRKLENAEELSQIENVFRLDRSFTYCQVPFMARSLGLTIGITEADRIGERCMRLHGLKVANGESMKQESARLATTWFASPEDALKQQHDYPRIPAGGAVVVAPLADERFEPEVVSIYGNPAQIMMLMCGMQKVKYERFHFFFIGEGACADSLAQCYVTGKPALAIPCFGERAIGQVADDEIVMALPPADVERAVSGLQKLGQMLLRYPIPFIGGIADVDPILARMYPDR
jgi:uncharacterized protein (DUF169 family)